MELKDMLQNIRERTAFEELLFVNIFMHLFDTNVTSKIINSDKLYEEFHKKTTEEAYKIIEIIKETHKEHEQFLQQTKK